MVPENLRYGGGAADTSINAIMLALMLVWIVLLFALPRKYIVLGFLPAVFLTPLGPALVIGGVHIFVSRLIVLAGLGRLLISDGGFRPSSLPGGFNGLDRIYVLWAVCRAAAFMLLYRDGGAMVNQAGFLYDALGDYFLLRMIIRNEEKAKRALVTTVCVAVVIAACMLNEQYSRHNIFGELGLFRSGVEVRDGRVRSQGPFLHPLLAGSFGGVIIPLCIWLWSARAKVLSALGVAASVVIVIASACSTSVLALAAGIFGLCFWPIRTKMQLVRRLLVAGIVCLAVVMKAPVWFVISHIDLTGSSSGYHRAMLIDAFIRHFSEWCLLGIKDASTWGYDLWDSCNQFVAEGEMGGFVALALFVLLLTRSFSKLGKARALAAAAGNGPREWFLWSIGAMLFAQTVAFFGISYFDQTQFFWLTSLAVISALTNAEVEAPRAPVVGPLSPARTFETVEESIVY